MCTLPRRNCRIFTRKCWFASLSDLKRRKRSSRRQKLGVKSKKMQSKKRNEAWFPQMLIPMLVISKMNSAWMTRLTCKLLRIRGRTNGVLANLATSTVSRLDMTGTSTIRLITIMITLRPRLYKATSLTFSILTSLTRPRHHNSSWKRQIVPSFVSFVFMLDHPTRILPLRLSIESGIVLANADSARRLNVVSCPCISTLQHIGIAASHSH
mmetsp:Transcript_30102/g.54458  ORF Transcript_30102/g.54458 Transcript_30102/m.54458 type:complete len:211 (-) Transcript_30102:23-655(-)